MTTRAMSEAIYYAKRSHNKELQRNLRNGLWYVVKENGKLKILGFTGFSIHTIDALVSAGLAEYTVRDACGKPIVMRLKCDTHTNG